jgi:hypothetical protein
LGRSGDIVAQPFAGDTPIWGESWTNIKLFYPGQVSWPQLNSKKHAGAEFIKRGQPVTTHHSVEQLQHYGVEAEFTDEIRHQWLLTLLAGIALISAFGFAINQLLKRNTGV